MKLISISRPLILLILCCLSAISFASDREPSLWKKARQVEAGNFAFNRLGIKQEAMIGSPEERAKLQDAAKEAGVVGTGIEDIILSATTQEIAQFSKWTPTAKLLDEEDKEDLLLLMWVRFDDRGFLDLQKLRDKHLHLSPSLSKLVQLRITKDRGLLHELFMTMKTPVGPDPFNFSAIRSLALVPIEFAGETEKEFERQLCTAGKPGCATGIYAEEMFEASRYLKFRTFSSRSQLAQ